MGVHVLIRQRLLVEEKIIGGCVGRTVADKSMCW